MYVNLRLNDEADKDLIDDIERFTGNKKFTRSDRVKELLRLGKSMEERSMSVFLSTGRHMPQRPADAPRNTPEPPPVPSKTTPPAKASKPLIKTPGWARKMFLE